MAGRACIPAYGDTVRDDGAFDRAAIMLIAVARTRKDVEGFARIGRRRAFRDSIAGELRLVWQSARAIRASLMAGRTDGALSPVERRARRLELAAEIAEGAIPARRDDAAKLRARAAGLRMSMMRRIRSHGRDASRAA
jgi:hypothetical protein